MKDRENNKKIPVRTVKGCVKCGLRAASRNSVRLAAMFKMEQLA
jgi:hypothetical protein